MEWGDATPLRTKVNRLEEGDLFVTVVNRYGLQTDNATSYCMEELQPTSMALSTMQARMDAVCQFQNWCGDRGIDFLQRVESGEFFQQVEITALREELRRNLVYQQPKKGSPKKPTSKRKVTERQTVGSAHWRNRCVAVRDYVAWFAEAAIMRRRPDDPILAEMRARLADFVVNMTDGIKVSRNRMKKGLEKEQEPVLLAAIAPGHPSNIFAARNHALWLTYYKGGLRLGEGIGLKTIDCILNGSRKRLIVHRRPDDPHETRRKPALAKTLPHPVEIDDHLAHVLHDYIVNHRPSYPEAKRSPYVFLSEDGGPLTHETVAYMYRRLREKVPGLPGDFCTNDARRAWNNRFAQGAAELGLSDDKSLVIANHAQGRTPTSMQGENYRGRYNEEKAAEIMQHMNEKLGATKGDTE
jgi:integrase